MPKSSKKKTEVKAGKDFKGEGTVSSYGSQKSRKVFEGKKKFPFDTGKAESCHNSKEESFD